MHFSHWLCVFCAHALNAHAHICTKPLLFLDYGMVASLSQNQIKSTVHKEHYIDPVLSMRKESISEYTRPADSKSSRTNVNSNSPLLPISYQCDTHNTCILFSSICLATGALLCYVCSLLLWFHSFCFCLCPCLCCCCLFCFLGCFPLLL